MADQLQAAKSVRRTEHIWLFGKQVDFPIYYCGLPLDSRQFQQNGAHPATHQKNQIVQHFTAGFGPARGTVDWWNTMAPLDGSKPWLCPNYFKHPPHLYAAAAKGECPDGHGKLTYQGNRASAHYVLDRAADRLSKTNPSVDVVEVVPSDAITWHGESVNNCSIGIEHANLGGTDLAAPPPHPNRFLHLANPHYPNSNLSSHDFHAYEDEQYRGMILLLRYLCIKHRIPRRFLGDTPAEKFERLNPKRDVFSVSKLMRFRGILSHMNCHKDKECGGPAMHRNRVFRGIIDEWWLPVEVDGDPRPYYMGPFEEQGDSPSYFRWNGAAVEEKKFYDCDIEAVQNTRSYYDLDRTDWYYAKSEDPAVAGTFPIGTNKVWHGGVHFAGPANNPRVFAAASGTIVAARLGEIKSVEDDPDLGSPRFVLIRHCVYWQQENDPAGDNSKRTNYTTDPTYVFTLYMHLAKFQNLDAADKLNPTWYNYWLRHRTGTPDPKVVFNPDVEVSVGDWIGQCGKYRGKDMIHFEVMSKEELTDAPWNDASLKIVDNDANVICDSATLNQFISAAKVTKIEALRAAPKLRNAKSFHKSEWALSDASSLTPVLPDAAARNDFWKRIKPLMWVADAVAANSDISTQLCDATGMMWHYHPVTFMDYVNRLVLRENGQVSEPDFRDTNVTMQDEYLRQFVNFTSGASVPAAADNVHVKPFSMSSTEYHFTRKDIACLLPAPHSPSDDPPKGTIFHISLLDVLENIRVSSGIAINVSLSFVCPAHNPWNWASLLDPPPNMAQCVLGPASVSKHAAGLAVDIRPTPATSANCRNLWNAAGNAADVFHATCGEHSGEPSHGELQGHAQNITVSTDSDVQAKLIAGSLLTPAEIHAFTIHLELTESTRQVVWGCWIKVSTKAVGLRLSGPNLVAAFADRASAVAESVQPLVVSQGAIAGQWESVVKVPSRATKVVLRSSGSAGNGIVGYFATVGEAQAEAVGDAWPEEV